MIGTTRVSSNPFYKVDELCHGTNEVAVQICHNASHFVCAKYARPELLAAHSLPRAGRIHLH